MSYDRTTDMVGYRDADVDMYSWTNQGVTCVTTARVTRGKSVQHVAGPYDTCGRVVRHVAGDWAETLVDRWTNG
jgi:hypothetical protein